MEMAREENDEDTLVAVEADTNALKEQVEGLEFRRMFSNPLDKNNCFIDIQAGAGGTEAQDWASMLLRQYLRYCERKGFKTEILEQSDGEVAGIKTATIKVEGDYAYGFLRTETGVHRLVRKSPFDSAGGRHTSFSSLFVYPEVDDSIEIDVNPADVRVDTYRASGAGGQHINKTDSAVRLTHTPSGIVVQCQNDRSQHRNRAEAWAMLKSRLFELEMRKRMSEQQKLEDAKTDIGWGHQIRSYVLQPYQLVKDLRTGVTSTSPGDVLRELPAFYQGKRDHFLSGLQGLPLQPLPCAATYFQIVDYSAVSDAGGLLRRLNTFSTCSSLGCPDSSASSTATSISSRPWTGIADKTCAITRSPPACRKR